MLSTDINKEIAWTGDTDTKNRNPLFILGSPRSGTTILASALRKAGYSGFNEGHLLNLVPSVKHLIERHIQAHQAQEKGQLLANIDADQFKREILDTFKKYQTLLNPKEPWLDRTPDAAMIYAAPTLAEMWPDAVFVFAKRRAIENIVSRIKKFPSVPFKNHCASWSESMSAWRSVRNSGIQGIEVDQFDIAHHPAREAERLANFLALSKEAAKRINDEFVTAQPQRTDEQSARRILELTKTGWTIQEMDLFKAYCSEEMEAYSYTTDDNYRSAIHHSVEP